MNLSKRSAVIGVELAKTLKLRIGSKVVFTTQNSSGEINSISLKIKGIVQTTNILMDSNAIFVDIKNLYKFLSIDETQATQISIRSENDPAIMPDNIAAFSSLPVMRSINECV